jgi:hypothetical protein
MPCIVVKRGETLQYDKLYRAFGDRMPVVWDRRRKPGRPPERPDQTEPEPQERRVVSPTSWVALGFVVAAGGTK